MVNKAVYVLKVVTVKYRDAVLCVDGPCATAVGVGHTALNKMNRVPQSFRIAVHCGEPHVTI